MPELSLYFSSNPHVVHLCLSFPWVFLGPQTLRSHFQTLEPPPDFGGDIHLWLAQAVLRFLLKEGQNCLDPWWATV